MKTTMSYAGTMVFYRDFLSTTLGHLGYRVRTGAKQTAASFRAYPACFLPPTPPMAQCGAGACQEVDGGAGSLERLPRGPFVPGHSHGLRGRMGGNGGRGKGAVMRGG